MLFINLKFTLGEISSYMASYVLPDLYENMRLEKIALEPSRLNGNGTQPLLLTYSMPGRVEDYEMRPEEHAFRLISSQYPCFLPGKAVFVPHSPLWTWDSEQMFIYIQPKTLFTEPSGEVISNHDAYVSVSRKRIFLSFEVVQEFLAAQLCEMGLEQGGEVSIRWDSNRSGIEYQAGNLTVYWLLSETESLRGILHFLGLDKQVMNVKSWAEPRLEKIQPTDSPEPGLMIPLDVRK